ncbi:hypothetical protein [Sphingobium tyrosinilyticum]|uniref:hypothetical protein n=1 Tax=Sphingobium tyrosinilyticum TaxID=2715436 RepID=UPI0036D2D652
MIKPRSFEEPIYWEIAHPTAGAATIVGFPSDPDTKLTTAMEVALVQAIAASPVEQHEAILAGDFEIVLGPEDAWGSFHKVIGHVKRPMTGSSILWKGPSQAIIGDNCASRLSVVALNCIKNSFNTIPIKYRFLELYRVMEARFLADIKSKLFNSFDAEPGSALNDALDALKSEMNQMFVLADTQKQAFEDCWTSLDAIKNTNTFVAALFRRIEKRKVTGRKHESGAALIYQIRCAVVHAGQKDMIFENFSDGDAAITAVLPFVERAALLLLDIDVN